MKLKVLLFSLLFVIAHSSNAGLWDNVKNTAVRTVRGGVKITTAPVESIIKATKVIDGSGKVSDIYQPYQAALKANGQVLPQAVGLLTQPQTYLMQEARKFASSAGGKPGEFLFDVGTFNQNLSTQLINASAYGVGGILQGQDPFQLSAIPLAAAIRAARETYISNALPLPQDVKDGLRLKGHFDEATLKRARYTVGKLEITLPNFIGQGSKLMGGDYAVTVDDVIVFNKKPGSFATNANWWAHEVTHVEQYEQLGIETFAYKYLRDAGNSLEREARKRASGITGNPLTANNNVLKVGSFDMSGTSSNVNYQKSPEFYIMQCIFNQDQNVSYLVTNYGRIIAVNPLTGEWVHLGYATPPRAATVAWSYDIPNLPLSYAIGLDQKIYTAPPILDFYGNVVNQSAIIGYTVRLR